jgi:hypothetical protein
MYRISICYFACSRGGIITKCKIYHRYLKSVTIYLILSINLNDFTFDTMKTTSPVQVNNNSTKLLVGYYEKIVLHAFCSRYRAIFLIRILVLNIVTFDSKELLVLFSAVYSIFPGQNNIMYSYCMSIISKSTSCRILLFVLMQFFCCCYIEVVFDNGNN